MAGPFSDALRNLVSGLLHGKVWPDRDERVVLPALTARAHALRRLQELLTHLVFRRPDAMPGKTRGFALKANRIQVEYPTSEKQILLPSIAFVPARGQHDYPLGPPEVVEETKDVYGKGTALLHQGDWVELFGVEIIASQPPIREGIKAGLIALFRAHERSSAVRLSLPAYYDRVASFALDESENFDDAEVILGRRRAELYVELQVPEVLLVEATTLKPMAELVELGPDVELDPGA
jgi:hypothetical protein